MENCGNLPLSHFTASKMNRMRIKITKESLKTKRKESYFEIFKGVINNSKYNKYVQIRFVPIGAKQVKEAQIRFTNQIYKPELHQNFT